MGYYNGTGMVSSYGGRGDPGFLSGLGRLAGNIFRSAGPLASFMPGVGGAIGKAIGIAGAIGSAMGSGNPTMPGVGFASPPTGPMPPPPMGAMGGMAKPMGFAGTSVARIPAMGGARAAGGAHYHVNKFGVTKFGRRPRMRVTNPKALRRAIRRAHGFSKLALKSIRLVSPQRLKGKHFGGFKTHRAKR